MKNLVLLLVISVAVIANSGCSSKLMSFEKRKYNQGYHVDFAPKKGKKAKQAVTENLASLPLTETKAIETAGTATVYQALPEQNTTSAYINEQESAKEADAKTKTVSKEKKKSVHLPVFNKLTCEKFKTTTKRGLEKFIPKRNTAATADFNIFTWAGAVIGGGGLVALAVMLFSNWATVTLLILLVSACFFGFILLIIGANT